jgi:hypothetical protein
MLDIHPPHHAASTRRDFFIHIATITLGLFIALALEQSVEALHHRHQRHLLEENLREELRANLRKDEEDFRKFAEIRAYLVQLKSAVAARRSGKPVPPPAPPGPSDTRRQRIPVAPSIAIWEAAKLDATLTLLPSEEIRLYHGVVLQYDLVFVAIGDFQNSAFALQSFEERFLDSTGAFDMGDSAPPPNLDSMSASELAEYESLLASYIKAIDRLVVRIHFFDRTARAILAGATSRDDVLRRAFPEQKSPEISLNPLPGAAAHD